MDIIDKFVAFELYRRSSEPVKYLFDEGVSKSGSGDKGIPH